MRGNAWKLGIVFIVTLGACSPAGLDTPGPLPIVVEREMLTACEPAPEGDGEATSRIPLMDQPEGLYGTGNAPPPDVVRAAQAATESMDVSDGRVVLLGIGMSNARMQFAALAPRIHGPHRILVPVPCRDCALDAWDDPGDPGFAAAREALASEGLSESDVDVVLVNNTRSALEAATADEFEAAFAAGRAAWPNARQWILTNRIYAGYMDGPGPEPAAHDVGYAIREFVLRHRGESVPAVFWGPDQWADGDHPRSDGLTWLPEDYRADMQHPSSTGAGKSADLWVDFFETSPLTRWY